MRNYLKKIFIYCPNFFLYAFYIFQRNNIILEFLFTDFSSKYNLTLKRKKDILKKIFLSFENVKSATSLEANIILLKYGLINLDLKTDGCIVECGCFKGASSITLSILAKITNKQLYIYDSFDGLPTIDTSSDKKAYYPHLLKYTEYRQGMYKGSLDEVKNNIQKYGYLENCVFIKGYFSETLKDHKYDIDFIFIDVDLLSSLKSCIINLWKYLSPNSYFFTDDSCDMNLVKIWFDDNWWKKNLNTNSPGYIGSGCGIPIKGKYSSLGYTLKHDIDNYELVYWE